MKPGSYSYNTICFECLYFYCAILVVFSYWLHWFMDFLHEQNCGQSLLFLKVFLNKID